MRFIYNLSNAPSASTPHLYLSALPFTPEDSLICKALRARFPCIANVAAGHHKEWPSTQILLQGHTHYVTSVAFSPDGTRIVSGSNDKTVRVWDAERGVQIGSPLQGHTHYVRAVAFSPDGTRIVSGSDDKTVRVWNVKRGVQIGSPLQGHSDSVASVAFSPDGTRIVSGSNDNTVRVWDSRRDVRISNDIERDAFQSNEESMESSTSGKPISHFRDIAVVLTPMCNRRLLFLFGHDSNQ